MKKLKKLRQSAISLKTPLVILMTPLVILRALARRIPTKCLFMRGILRSQCSLRMTGGRIRKAFVFLLALSLLISQSLNLFLVSPAYAATFTAGQAKRDAPGPFAAAPIVQGNADSSGTPDLLRVSGVSQIKDYWYENFDKYQGSVAFWITPEWNGNDGLRHRILRAGPDLILEKNDGNSMVFGLYNGISLQTSVSSWVAGETHLVIGRWDFKNTIDGTNYGSITIDNSTVYGDTSVTSAGDHSSFIDIGSGNGLKPANALIEGLTIYRRPLYDGTYGVDVGNGDEISQIYASGTGADPTLITGSWDVVFALPTNSSTGALATGTGEAWSHPHSSNVLTDGFGQTAYASSGWGDEGTPKVVQGIEYNGTTTSTVVSDAAVIQDLHDNAFTAEAWIRADGWGENNAGHIITKNGNAFEGWTLQLSQNYGIEAWLSCSDDSYMTSRSGIDEFIPDGKLHHVVMQYDDGGDRKTYLWIDGVPINSYPVQDTCSGTIISDVGNDLYIGNRSYPAYTWDGLLGGWSRISNVSRYTNGKAFVPNPPTNPPTPDINTVWQTDYSDGSGTTLTDDSGNGNNGTISNGTWDTVKDLSTVAPGERVYPWGYVFGSDAANEGIKQTKSSLTAGQNYVARPVIHYGADGRGQARVRIRDETNGANIVDLDGPKFVGTHDGAADASALADSTARWINPDLTESATVYNITDGSSGTISAYTQTTVTATLSGGTDNDWDNGDSYRIVFSDGYSSHPWTEPFTWELPTNARNGAASDCTSISVKVLNASTEGTIYVHQLEVLENLIDNPSLETGAAVDPWIPDGWTNSGLDTGDSETEATTVHSGSGSMQWNTGANRENIYKNINLSLGDFFAFGGWTYGDGSKSFNLMGAIGDWSQLQHSLSEYRVTTSSTISWSHELGIWRGGGQRIPLIQGEGSAVGNRYSDDFYSFQLNDVSLTVTPASEANSTENTDEIRVDGGDSYVESSASSIGTTSGYASFDYRPRHAAADAVKFVQYSTDDAYIVTFDSGSRDTGYRDYGGSGNQSSLTDSSRSWTTDQWVGYTIYNLTDGSSGAVTANTATTVTASLSGGSENDWDKSDTYTITSDDYINIFWDSANTIKMTCLMDGAACTTDNNTWDATGAIAADSQYAMVVQYTGGDTMTLTAGGTERISLSSIPSAFGLAPDNVYFGSDSSSSNQGDATFSELVFDNTAPSISLTALSPDPNSDNTPSLTGTATEAIGTVSNVQYQMDGTGGSWTACTADDGTFDEASEAFTCTVGSALSDGSHTMYVRATDSNGNTTAGGSESSDAFTIDATNPTVSLTAISPDPGTDSTPTISGTATNATTVLTAIQYQIDGVGGSWTTCTADDGTIDETSETFSCTVGSALSDGAHTIYVRATDTASNNSSNESDAFTIDTTAPSVSVTALTPDPSTDSTPSITGTVTDATSALTDIEYQVDGTSGSWTDCTANDGSIDETSEAYTCTPGSALSDGGHTMYIRATDSASNTTALANYGSETFTVDTTGISISLTAISPDPGTDNTPTITGTATDETGTVASVEYQMDSTSGSWSSCTADDDTFDESSETFSCTAGSALSDGAHTIYIRATDNVANVSTTYSDTFTIDVTAPVSFTPTADPSSWSTDSTPTISFSTTDATAGVDHYEVKVNVDGSYSTQSSPYTLPIQSDGEKTVYVKAVDGAGNETEGSVSIYVDTTAPNVFSLDSPSHESYTSDVRPTFRWKAASTPDETSGLSKYKLEISSSVILSEAKDPLSFTIDNIPVSQTSNYSTSKYLVKYEGFSDADSSNNYISVYTKSSSAWSSSENDGKLKEGKRYWKVSAVDNAGNEREESRTLYVDLSPPSFSDLSIDRYGERDGYQVVTDLTPSISGSISDNLYPDKIEFRFYNQHFFLGIETSRTLELLETLNHADENPSTTDGYGAGADSTPKSWSFSFSPSQPLDFGKYYLSITGIDKAGNEGGEESLNLQVLTDDKAKQLFKGEEPEDKDKDTDQEGEIPESRERQRISLPELEKQALTRREREAQELQEFGESLQGQLDHLWNRVSNELADLSAIANKFASTIFSATPEVVKQALNLFIIKPWNAVNHGIEVVDHTLANSQERFKDQIAETHHGTSEKMRRIGERMGEGTQSALAVFARVLEPAKKGTDTLARIPKGIIVSSSTFYAHVFDPRDTEIYHVTLEEVGTDYAIVSWKTNHYTFNNKLNYGEEVGHWYEEARGDSWEKHHIVKLTNLKPNTQYFYEVMSQNKNYVYDAHYSLTTLGD